MVHRVIPLTIWENNYEMVSIHVEVPADRLQLSIVAEWRKF